MHTTIMQETLSKGILLLVLSACLPSAMALDPVACQERLKSVDDRIASGKYSAQNVQLAQQMRDSIMQSCAYLDEAAVGKMMEGFENLLPTKSEAERKADRDAKHAERDVQRDIQRAELESKRAERSERERKEALEKKPSVSEVLKRPPTAQSVFGEFVDRDDGMYYVEIYDWDLYRGKVRVLYVTSPSHDQFVRGRRQHFIYVIEADAHGTVVQHHVTGEPTDRIAAARLRRGHDEVVLQHVVAGTAGESGNVERWSISGQKRLSSISAPTGQPLRMSTSDGNVLFVAGMNPRGKTSSVSWMTVSLEGKVLARGTRESDISKLSTLNWFYTPNGGAGFVILELANTDKGIDSKLAPIARRIGAAEITAVVGGETRLLVTGNGTKPAWESPAIARSFMWLGLPELGPIITLEGQAELDRVTGEIDREHGGRIRLVDNVVVPIDDGYGVLVENDYRNEEQPPVHGSWLYEYGINGEVRETYLNPEAEHLKTSFRFLAANERDLVFLYGGSSPSYVVQLDEERRVAAYGKPLIGQRTTPDGLIAADDGVWVLGTGESDDGLQTIWLERIQF